ncbi:MAG TPA: ABC transporter permease [Thermoanaerobaculia bacterium]|nr:ABC transporter permease [Thermoanaerobaculia bacterium]
MSVAAGEPRWDYDSANRRAPAVEEALDLARNVRLVSAFVVRDIKARYKRSVLGVAWSFAGPLLLMVVLTVAFSQVFAIRGRAYPVFVLPGLLLWNFFAQTTINTTSEVAAGVDLWRRVRMPKSVPAVSAVLTNLVHLGIAVVVLLPILLIIRAPLGWAAAELPVVMILTALFTLGVAFLTSTVALYFPDLGHVWSVVLPAWMFVTPVIYPTSILPARARQFVGWNPMTRFVSAFRALLSENRFVSLRELALLFLIAFGTLTIGWIAFTRHADEIPYRA